MKSVLILIGSLFALNALAQAPTPFMPSGPSGGGIAGFITNHGGLQLTALLFLGCLNIALSAVRDILAKFDGVAPGAQAPSGALGVLQSVCFYLGKVVDYLQGNVQH